MKRPLLAVSLVFAGGILLGWWLDARFWQGAAFSLTAFLGYLFTQRHRWNSVCLYAAVLGAGCAAYAYATAIPSPKHLRNLVVDGRSQNVELRGMIVSDPREKEFATNNATSPAPPSFREVADNSAPLERVDFVLKAVAIKLRGEWREAEGNVLVYVNARDRSEEFDYGHPIHCSALLQTPDAPRNPGLFDFRAYLATNGIHFVARVRQRDFCHIEKTLQGKVALNAAYQLRDKLRGTLHDGLFASPVPSESETRRVAGLLSGMLLGYREDIPPELRDSFTRTSAMHVFAISGLHVGMMATVLFFALRLLRLSRRWSALAAIPLLLFYVMMTGMRPSAVRAFVMTAVFIACWIWIRPSDALNSLGAAALVVLVFQPLQLFDGGFQMSFAVVGSILVGMPLCEKLLINRFAADPFLPRESFSPWRRGFDKVWIPLARYFALTVAAWIGSAPFIAYYFNLVSPISLLSNVAVVFLAFCMVATGFVAAVASLFSDWLVVTLNNANLFFGVLMIRIVDWLAQIPWGYFFVKPPSAWLMAAYYAAMVAVMTGWMFRKWIRVFSTASVSCAVALALAWTHLPQPDEGEVTFLDVGSGSAVFVDLPGKDRDALIDAGREGAARHTIAPFLQRNGLATLPRLIVTQWDVNHSGGLAGLTPQIKIGEIVETGWRNPSGRTQKQMLELAQREGIPLRRAAAKDAVLLGDYSDIRVLHPPAATPFKTFDDNSMVIHLRIGGVRMLLMSDAGETVEKWLVNSNTDLKSDVLVLGSHSRETMGTPEFLDRVGARTVILNRGDPWGGKGAPSELLQRLKERGVRVFDTAEHGAVTVRVKNNRAEMKSVLSPP